MKIDLDFIIDTIEAKTNLKLSENTRKRPYILCRAIYYKIAKEYTFNTLSDIGAKFGKGHATVLHGLKVFDEIKIYDKDLYEIYKDFHNRYPVELVDKGDEPELMMTDKEKSIVEKFNEMVELIEAKDKEINKLNIEIELMRNNGDDKRSNMVRLASQVPQEQLEVFEQRVEAMVKMIR